jgi:hypothetical protein
MEEKCAFLHRLYVPDSLALSKQILVSDTYTLLPQEDTSLELLHIEFLTPPF